MTEKKLTKKVCLKLGEMRKKSIKTYYLEQTLL